MVCIGENKIKEKVLITLPDYTNFIKSFETALNSKHILEKLKTKRPKIQRHGKPKQKDEHLVLQKE